MLSTVTRQEFDRIKTTLSDKKARLNSGLYRITDERGEIVPFYMNSDQEAFFDEMWYQNIILKARQRGFTTLALVDALDNGLWNSNQSFGLSVHNLNDGKRLFREKVLDVYDRLPDIVKATVPVKARSVTQLILANGSTFTVGVSLRSATMQRLHISEFGKLCAKFPEKAKEVVTGSLNTVHVGQIVTIESTAEGRGGYFYNYCKKAMDLHKAEKNLAPIERKFFFFPWFNDPKYEVDPEGILIPQEYRDYFEELRAKHGIELSDRKKAWYVIKSQDMQDKELMFREFPSYPEEAFYASMEGSYYGKYLLKAREEKRILESLPVDLNNYVYTAWDLGYDDSMAIWWFQVIGPWVHLIDFYEANHAGLEHYLNIMDEKQQERGFQYAPHHYAPHDVMDHSWVSGNVAARDASARGINFIPIPRIKIQREGIQAVRRLLPATRFDETRCTRKHGDLDVGINSLECYRNEWNEDLQRFMDTPKHDWASHGAKAFETLAFAVRDFIASSGAGQEDISELNKKFTPPPRR